VKREPVPTNWEEREAASATTTGAPAAAAAEIGAKRARNEAEESGEEEAPTRTKVLIRGAEAETETPKKTDEKSGDTRQLQPGQGWTIEAARRRIFAALKKITEATNREMTEKLTFRRDDQRQVREAQDEIQEAVSDMLMEVVLAREERVLQVRLQRMEAPAGRDMRGPSQKKLDQLREDLAKEAGVEPPARKGAQPPTEQWETVGKKGAEKPQGGQTKGAQQQGGPTEGARPQEAPTKGTKRQVGPARGERLVARRTAAGRVPEKLRVPHQEEVPEREAAEHGLRRGTENPPRGNGERKGRRRPDPLLRNGGDPGEAVLQVPSFRPHSEGVQEQGAVLQVLQEGHRKSECTAEAKRCPNCVRARRGQTNHGATDRKCPEFQRMMQLKASRTARI
jgi:hypothetical protein